MEKKPSILGVWAPIFGNIHLFDVFFPSDVQHINFGELGPQTHPKFAEFWEGWNFREYKVGPKTHYK